MSAAQTAENGPPQTSAAAIKAMRSKPMFSLLQSLGPQREITDALTARPLPLCDAGHAPAGTQDSEQWAWPVLLADRLAARLREGADLGDEVPAVCGGIGLVCFARDEDNAEAVC